jgi:hypothetical protein
MKNEKEENVTSGCEVTIGRWDGSARRKFTIGARVRFSEVALTRKTPAEAKRLTGRVGTVTGYRAGAADPIVDFSQEGRRKALRLFEVSSNHLEILP